MNYLSWAVKKCVFTLDFNWPPDVSGGMTHTAVILDNLGKYSWKWVNMWSIIVKNKMQILCDWWHFSLWKTLRDNWQGEVWKKLNISCVNSGLRQTSLFCFSSCEKGFEVLLGFLQAWGCRDMVVWRHINSCHPPRNGRHFADDIFKCIFVNEKFCILNGFSRKFVPKSLINNIPALVEIMAWRQSGDKPISEPMLT